MKLSTKEISKIKKQIKEEKADKAKAKTDLLKQREFYNINSLIGYSWASKFFLLGAREAGKSYATMELYIKQYRKYKRPFYWLRMTDKQVEKLLKNNADKFVDPDLRRKYKLDLRVKGNIVYEVLSYTKPDKEGHRRAKKLRKFATVLAIGTFYGDKGQAMFDAEFLDNPKMYYNICLDEMNREKGEKKNFDIVYSFYNQIENLIRSTINRVRIICIGNLLDDDASDLLAGMNFIPEKYGRYTLVKHKAKLLRLIKELDKPKEQQDKELINELKDIYYGERAVVEYMENSDAYKTRRLNAVSTVGSKNSSTFTNEVKIDKSLISKTKLTKPLNIIKFGKSESEWFTLWNDGVICQYNKEKKEVIAMKPYLNELYFPKVAQSIITNFDLRIYKYKDYVTFKKFENSIIAIKPRGN